MRDLITLGETMALLSAPRTGRLRDMGSLDLAVGGAESNVAIGMQRLGCRTGWIGRVGNDEFGHLILDRLRREGVDIGSAVVDASAPTALMTKERRTADLVRVGYYRRGSAGSRLEPDDIPEDVVAHARVLHVTGITPALSRSARAAAYKAVEIARDARVLVSFDVNYRSALWSEEEAGRDVASLAKQADVVFAGPEELQIIDPDKDADTIARDLVDHGVAEVVIKRGAAGATRVVGSGTMHCPAVPVRAIDSVGAGDAFVAGYLTATLDGVEPEARLSLGCAMGAYAVTFPGDCDGLPSRDDLRLLDLSPGHTLR